MKTELDALREEIAKLRERIAVLESRPVWQHPSPGPYQPIMPVPQWVAPQWPGYPVVTCGPDSWKTQ